MSDEEELRVQRAGPLGHAAGSGLNGSGRGRDALLHHAQRQCYVIELSCCFASVMYASGVCMQAQLQDALLRQDEVAATFDLRYALQRVCMQ